MPANKYALYRYLIIDRMLKNPYRKFPKKDDIREKCEEELYGLGSGRVSLSTIEKDMAAMREEFDAPIIYSRTGKGYCYADKGYSFLGSEGLVPTELDALTIAIATLYQYRDIGFFKNYQTIIENLHERMRLSPEPMEHTLNKVMQFQELPLAHGREWLQTAFEAIKLKNELEITYHNIWKGDIKKHVIEPCMLKEYHHRWYLIAYEKAKKGFYTYALDRIEEMAATGMQYIQHRDFDGMEHFKNSIGISIMKGRVEKIVLRFTGPVGKLILNQPLHSSQELVTENNEQVTVSLKLCITPELEMQILSYGDRVKVIKPESFAKAIQEKHKLAAMQYDKRE